jgi:hypothetical protein
MMILMMTMMVINVILQSAAVYHKWSLCLRFRHHIYIHLQFSSFSYVHGPFDLIEVRQKVEDNIKTNLE